MSHVINSRALTGECTATQLSIWSYRGHRFAVVIRFVLPGPRTSIVSGNDVSEKSVKRRNKIVQEITRNVANVISFYAIIVIEYGFSMHEHLPGPLGGVENRGLWPRFSTPPTGPGEC